MLDTFENWNENPKLWSSIERILKTLTENFEEVWVQDSIRSLKLTKNCWLDRNEKDLEQKSFTLKANYTLNKSYFYPEDRYGKNKKVWQKQKEVLESSFKVFFPNFKIPEQSYKPVVNPLYRVKSNSYLNMEDQVSNTYSLNDIEKLLGLDITTDYFTDFITFKFTLNRQKTNLKTPVRNGVNEIEDSNEAQIKLNIGIFLKFPVDYCLYVLSSTVLSEVLFFNYVNLQLTAYQGLNNYPNSCINIMQSKQYAFNTITKTPDYLVSYPKGDVYYIPRSTLNYEQYLAETKTLYNISTKEITGSLVSLPSIQNKVINYDSITQQLIYTDSLGVIQKLDLTGAEPYVKNSLQGLNIQDEKFQNFLKFLKSFYYRINISNKLNFTSALEELTGVTFIKEITISNCPSFIQLCNTCYNNFDSLNFDLMLKCRFKVFLEEILSTNKEVAKETSVNKEIKTINLTESYNLPIDLIKLLKINQKNELINFVSYLRDTYFFSKISCMLYNNQINRPVIITYEPLEVYNRLQCYSNNNFNGVILNNETIRKLYKQFGNNLLAYFKSLPKNTLFILHPNIFFESSIFGDTDLYLANKLCFRSLIVELLQSINFDYVIFYKNKELDLTDLVIKSIRRLFIQAKYRCIYGQVNKDDSIILDPNTVLNSSYEVREVNDTYTAYFPTIENNLYFVDTPKIQQEFYQELVDLGIENLKNNNDFKKALAVSSLDSNIELAALISNFLSQADIFLNAPDANLFLFKEKFEDINNENLKSSKLDLLYNIISSHLYGGVVEGVRKNPKRQSILIVCENRVVQDHLYKNLNSRFFGDICYKFKTGVPSEIKVFQSKRIGFITKDIFLTCILPNVSSYIFVQNSWKEYFTEINNAIYLNLLNSKIEENVDVSSIVFNTSLEINKLYQSLYNYIFNNVLYSSLKLDAQDLLQNLTSMEIGISSLSNLLTSNKIASSNIFYKYKTILKAQDFYSKKCYDYLLDTLFTKTGIKFSTKDIFDINFVKIEKSPVNIGNKAYVPYINNMYLNFYNLIPATVEEDFSTVNGNYYQYNEKLQDNFPILTEYGCGYLSNNTKSGYIVKILGIDKEFVVALNTIYIPRLPQSEKFFEYIKLISNTGDSLIDQTLLQPTTLDNKQDTLELDTPDNTIDLSIDRINGLFSLYTSNIDSDNIRLETFDFNKFSNIFAVSLNNLDTYNNFVSYCKKYNVNASYLEAIQQIYKAWNNRQEFIVPPVYNYFQTVQTLDNNPRMFALIWRDTFYIIFNGNFYPKLGLKLSRKFNVTLIKSLYIQQFITIKDCKYEVLKVSKTLDIINFNQILDYFNKRYLKLDFIELNIQEDENSRKDRLLKLLKVKEQELKEHIKTLKEENNNE